MLPSFTAYVTIIYVKRKFCDFSIRIT